MNDDKQPPPALDLIADKVLAYRPKPKSAPAKKRVRKKKKLQRESSTYFLSGSNAHTHQTVSQSRQGLQGDCTSYAHPGAPRRQP